MPFHHLKRLNPHSRFHKHLSIHSNLNNDDFLRQSPKYKKYFDYSLDELLVDHSTDPLQNTTRQYVKNSSISSIDNANDPGRFAHHQMIIRQEKGETKLLRPKSDPVLIKGFTKKIQHSSTVPSGPSVVTRPISHNASISMIKKMKKTQKYPHRRPPKSAFTPLPMDNVKAMIDCLTITIVIFIFEIVSKWYWWETSHAIRSTVVLWWYPSSRISSLFSHRSFSFFCSGINRNILSSISTADERYSSISSVDRTRKFIIDSRESTELIFVFHCRRFAHPLRNISVANLLEFHPYGLIQNIHSTTVGKIIVVLQSIQCFTSIIHRIHIDLTMLQINHRDTFNRIQFIDQIIRSDSNYKFVKFFSSNFCIIN